MLIKRPYEYSLDVPRVMNFPLVPLLPRLVVMVAKFFMCERKVSNLIYVYILINNHGKQYKVMIKRPVAT